MVTGKVVDFIVGAEMYQTWYEVLGDLTSGLTPLVLLHGGPGWTHQYMLPFKTLYESAGIPMVFYDQLGSGQSTHLRDAPEGFWTVALFMDELENLLKHLGIADNFNLLGHSWGGVVAGDYATRIPNGLKRLIISHSPSSVPMLGAEINRLLEAFPKDFVDLVRKHERDGTQSSTEYKSAVLEFYRTHVYILPGPWPESLVSSLAAAEEDGTVFHAVVGPSPFCYTGTAKDWSIIDVLHNISCPTLIISGVNDEVTEPTVLPWFTNIPKVKWVELQNSTHLPMYEEPEKYFKVILDFLNIPV